MNQIDNIMALADEYAAQRQRTNIYNVHTTDARQALRAAIEQALAVQPKQEPVAWLYANVLSGSIDVRLESPETVFDLWNLREEWHSQALYTTPQPHLKAMQQALEALECAVDYTGSAAWSPSATKQCIEAADVLREVLGGAK